jgi:hypothetical protein
LQDSSTASIINNIHWNNDIEFEGTGASISYSLIEGGYTGVCNIDSNPLFNASAAPAGSDGIWGTDDDGLRLTSGSPAIGVSSDSFPDLDIAETYRQANDSGKNDLGAYTFVPPSSSIYNSDAVFGYFDGNGNFNVEGNIRVFAMFENEWGYILAKNSNRTMYARLLVDDKKQTRDINEGPVTLSAHDVANTSVYSKVISIQRAGDGAKINGKLVFYSKYPIMFLTEPAAADYLNSAMAADNLYFMCGDAAVIDRFVITAYTDDYR